MRFGLGLPVASHPLPDWIQSLDAVVEVTAAAAAAGFDHVFVTDHPAPPRRWLEAGGHDAFDPFVALAVAATADPGIGLLTNLVPLSYRHPFVLAKAVASLDRLSSGRLTLGVGVGYLRAEFAALDVGFDERNDRFDECLQALRRLWGVGEGPVSVATSVDRVDEIVPLPAPAGGGVPIWIGGNAARTRQRVVDHAAGWMPMPNPSATARHRRSPAIDGPDDLARMLDDLRTRAAVANRAEPIEVVYVVTEGGSPGTAEFDAGAHVDAVRRYAGLGVTGNNVTVAGRTRSEVLATIDHYGREVIAEVVGDQEAGAAP